MNLDVCQYSIVCNYLKEKRSWLEFCEWYIYIYKWMIYFNKYIPYSSLTLVWKPWGRTAFSRIAFYSQQCKKERADMPSEFKLAIYIFLWTRKNVFCWNTNENKHCPQILFINLHWHLGSWTTVKQPKIDK